MKVILLILTLFTSFCLSGQIVIDSILETVYHYSAANEIGSNDTYVIHSNDIDNNVSIFRYDQNLNIIDTLTGADVGRINVVFRYPFTFNNSLYFLCYGNDSATFSDFSFHKLENGVFTDSIGFDLDSISGAYPFLGKSIDANTLQLIVNVNPEVFPGIITSRILHLDSNFQLKSYHNPNVDTTLTLGMLTAIHQLSNTKWHLYFGGTMAVYNPIQKSINSSKRILFRGHDTYSLPNKNHLALGVTSYPIKPPLGPSNRPSSLGFYLVDSLANILDTIQFNAYKDTVPSLHINNYSSEAINSSWSSSVVYDTNNIYLACNGDYTPFNSSSDFRYFYVVKTDIKGNKAWDFTWGGLAKTTTFTGVTGTNDQGCVIVGNMTDQNFDDYAIVIKLGPDGKISNVEFDVPETVVNFYPNPVKDKLHYSFLPEAQGSYTLEIVDMQGKPVLEKKLDNKKGFISLSLKSGFYLYNLIDEKGKVQQVGKILVKE
ncbi:T9SS type A sorting domain-containing protein [Owenweeksia hongkongensis]|uniref:T9SS type A sorting domain-containing protein n=1 Tax=Owenweeksia hongkongensis TaxID=253245 RepID=UPI003A92ADF0